MQNTELCTVTLHVSSQEVWGGVGRRRDREHHWARQLPVLLFSNKTEKKKKKKGKKEKNLPAESRPSFSHYCGSLWSSLKEIQTRTSTYDYFIAFIMFTAN